MTVAKVEEEKKVEVVANVNQVPTQVVVHPLVLLSVADHYNRVAKDTNKRVVGILLGSWKGKTIDIANSYAVPFDEDSKDSSVWFLDHNYHETMWTMFRKINAREKVIGWYHSGPKLRSSDLEINELIRRFTPNPLLVVVDLKAKDVGLPTDAYVAVEEIQDNGKETKKTFHHVPSTVAAEEAEEIGVEHLLRDISDNVTGTLSSRISDQLMSLKGLANKLTEIRKYLEKVISGKLPVNHDILYNLQDIFNLLPNLNVEELIKSFNVKTNDHLFVIYLSSLIRSVIALHDLINNKIANQEAETEVEKKEKENKEKAEKEKAEKKKKAESKEEEKEKK